MSQKNYIFVGAGASNIWAILWLLKNNWDGKIIVYDKGKSPDERKDNELLNGFFGSGMHSDGKNVFATYQDSTPSWIDKTKFVPFIKEIYNKFLGEDKISITKPVDCSFPLELKQSETWHLGTTNNRIFAQNIHKYMLCKGVQFNWEYELTGVDFVKDEIRIENNARVFLQKYDYLQLGLGKTGCKYIYSLINEQRFVSKSIHFGGRFECAYNENIRNIAENIQYDFKFVKKYEDIEFRTFCINNKSAYVVEEKIDSRIQYNGHAYGKSDPSKTNNLTNFAILAEIPTNVRDLQEQYIRNIYGMNFRISGSSNIKFNSSITCVNDLGNNMSNITHVLHCMWGEPLTTYLFDFIKELNKILKFEDQWCMYFPEIKLTSGTLQTNEYMEVDGVSNVKFVGDSSAGTRGIVPAALSGIQAVQNIK